MLVVLFAGGCGVADYESRMVDAQKRLEHFEEASRLLDSPLVPPLTVTKEGSKVPIANMFLRPPKGIADKPADEPRMRILYSYRRRTAGPVLWVELAFGNQKEFAGEVLSCFGATGKTSQQRTVRDPVRNATNTFTTTEIEDEQFFYSINIHQDGKSQIAVIYHVPRGQRGAAARAVELSLASFAVGREANRQRDLYAKGSPLQVPREVSR
jgi:hypothetical protein